MSSQTNAVATRDEATHEMQTAAQAGVLTPMEMLGRALEAGMSVEVLDKLMALQERYEANLGRKAFDNAIASAKAEIDPVKKNRKVSYEKTEYWHEDLAEIARTVDPVLSRFGLSYRFRTETGQGVITVACVLSHRDGYSEETSLSSAPDASGKKNSIQAIGSAITYLQRYTLKAALGLSASTDDDGAGADAANPDRATITVEDATALETAITDAHADRDALLTYFKIDSLLSLTVKDLGTARKMLAAKVKQNAAAKAAAEAEANEESE